MSLLGDKTDTQTARITGSVPEYTVTFESIPLGSEVYASANVFCPSAPSDQDSYLHLFTGTSPSIVISSDENEVSLMMTDMTRGDASLGGSASSDQAYQLELFSNGKYQLHDNAGTVTVIYSEGTWSGNYSSSSGFAPGTTLNLTEYAYRSGSSVIMLENPRTVFGTVSSGGAFSFRSAGGTAFTINDPGA